MVYDILAVLAAAPETGDNFQSGKIIFIGAAAVIVAAGMAVLAGVFGGKKQDDDEDDESDE